MARESEELANALNQFVGAALRAKQAGQSSQNYSTIVQQLQLKGEQQNKDPAALARWYRALTKNASLVRAEFKALLEALASFHFRAPTETVREYCELLATLTTTVPALLSWCLTVFVKRFLVTNGEEADEELTGTVMQTIHKHLEGILARVPAAPTSLFELLVMYFPHTYKDALVLQIYVKNLLQTFDYCPILKDQILTLIIERLLLMDVEITKTLEEPELEESDSSDDDDDDDDKYEEDIDNSQENLEKLQIKDEESVFQLDENKDDSPSKKMIDKLDSLMQLMFEYLRVASLATVNEKLQVFLCLLRVFMRSVLKTHDSRFIQFLIFYMASGDPTFPEALLTSLFDTATDSESKHAVDRKPAVAYIAGFISRAKYFHDERACYYFDKLLEWTLSYIAVHDVRDGALTLEEAQRHTIFYAFSQAVLYIYVFRRRGFDNIDNAVECEYEQKAQERRIALSRLLRSPWQPLSWVNKHVARKFHQIAIREGIVPNGEFSRSVDETGRPVSLVSGFFPFDPYRLRSSQEYVVDIYTTPRDVQDDADNGDNRIRPSVMDIDNLSSAASSLCQMSLDTREPYMCDSGSLPSYSKPNRRF
jgi:RNA polymerase I-specific transcription initiation factor RRN3